MSTFMQQGHGVHLILEGLCCVFKIQIFEEHFIFLQERIEAFMIVFLQEFYQNNDSLFLYPDMIEYFMSSKWKPTCINM